MINTIDITDIPRYKASSIMQKVFVTNADSCGDHVFTQIIRKHNIAVYHRTKVKDGVSAGYETITIKKVPAGTIYGKGAEPTPYETESYPGAASFGRSAWTYGNKQAALNKMEERLSAISSKLSIDNSTENQASSR